MIRLEPFGMSDDRTWDDLVASYEGGTIFHTLAWLRVIAQLKGAEPLPMGIVDGARLVGVFPLFRLRRGPLTVLASPLGSVGYGGPLGDVAHCQAAVDQLGKLAKRFNADYVEFRSLRDPASLPSLGAGYLTRELKTTVLSFRRSPPELWMNLRSECRTAVRKAQKQGVEVVEATDDSFVDRYYAMAEDTYAKARRPAPLGTQDYRAVWNTLRPLDRAKVLLAKHDGKVIAGAIILRFRDRLYFWDGVALRQHYHLRGSNLLQWSLIEWGANNGIAEYDMLGANIPTIARFKSSFGGESRTYTYAQKELTPLARVSLGLYRWLAPRLQRVRFLLGQGMTRWHAEVAQ